MGIHTLERSRRKPRNLVANRYLMVGKVVV